MSAPYACPQCGESADVRVDCWRCEIPVVDAGGRLLRACSGRTPRDYRQARRTGWIVAACVVPVALLVLGFSAVAMALLVRTGWVLIVVAAAGGVALARWDERRRWANDQWSARREARTLSGEGIERVRGVVELPDDDDGDVAARLNDGVLSFRRFLLATPEGERAWVGDANMEVWSDAPVGGAREPDATSGRAADDLVVRAGDDVEAVGPAVRTDEAFGLMSNADQLVHLVLLRRA